MAQTRVAWGLDPEEPAILILDNAPTRADLHALQTLAAAHIHVVTLPPHLTHIMRPVDVFWAWAFETEYGRHLRKWVEPAALDRAYWQLPDAAAIRGRTPTRDSRVCIAFASVDAARGATSTFNARHAFCAAGLVPFNASKPLASQYVRDCEEDVERAEEAKHPGRLHTGSRVMTSAEFLARLSVA
jgi:hypothetical protein